MPRETSTTCRRGQARARPDRAPRWSLGRGEVTTSASARSRFPLLLVLRLAVSVSLRAAAQSPELAMRECFGGDGATWGNCSACARSSTTTGRSRPISWARPRGSHGRTSTGSERRSLPGGGLLDGPTPVDRGRPGEPRLGLVQGPPHQSLSDKAFERPRRDSNTQPSA